MYEMSEPEQTDAGARLASLERRLWDAADELRANSGLTPAEYSLPVLALVFSPTPTSGSARSRRSWSAPAQSRRTTGKVDYQAQGVIYLPPTTGSVTV